MSPGSLVLLISLGVTILTCAWLGSNIVIARLLKEERSHSSNFLARMDAFVAKYMPSVRGDRARTERAPRRNSHRIAEQLEQLTAALSEQAEYQRFANERLYRQIYDLRRNGGKDGAASDLRRLSFLQDEATNYLISAVMRLGGRKDLRTEHYRDRIEQAQMLRDLGLFDDDPSRNRQIGDWVIEVFQASSMNRQKRWLPRTLLMDLEDRRPDQDRM